MSGKGVDAGTRALLLSGAFGGLLGSVPHEEFLPATNRYLLRQHWEEGFATVAHVVIDLATGEYVVSVGRAPAGRAVQRRARAAGGSARPARARCWAIFPDAKFVSERGRLDRGDALLMFTDGLIEKPGQDIVGRHRQAARARPSGWSPRVSGTAPASSSTGSRRRTTTTAPSCSSGASRAGRAGAGDRDRTRMTSLEGWGSAIELHPRERCSGSAVRRRRTRGPRMPCALRGVA